MAPWCSRCFYTSSLMIFAQVTKFKSLLKSVVCDQIMQRANSYTFQIFDEFQSPLSPLLLLLLIPSRARAVELPLFWRCNMLGSTAISESFHVIENAVNSALQLFHAMPKTLHFCFVAAATPPLRVACRSGNSPFMEIRSHNISCTIPVLQSS